jgi:glycosyltransferase involved in cell wall biosynthesis
MRIVHVITALNTGGAEMMLKKVISETTGLHEHIVISLKNVGPIGRSLRSRGIPVIALGGMSGRFSFPLLFRLAKELRSLKPDLVQAWMYHANFAAWSAKLLSRGEWPLYWSVRCSVGEPRSIKWTTRFIRNICAPLSGPVTSIIYNSHIARRQHEDIGYPAAKGVVIPNGFDTEHFHPDEDAKKAFRRRHAISDNQIIVGHVARAQVMKDQPSLLRAALKVTSQVANAVFVLAGPGIPDLPRTRRDSAAAIAALGGRLLLLPEQENVNELMAAFDVFVLSSAFGEGFPNVLGEALSSGTPCVATDVGDCALIVGENGIIVPPRDPESLASGISKLLNMPSEDRKSLGLAGRARVQTEYSLAAIGRAYVDQWEERSKNLDLQGAQCAE